MYEKFFQFAEPPFKLTPDPRFFFFSKKHEEAFDHIRYGIQERKGFIVVTGEVGTGKTTLSRLLLEKLDKKIQTSMIFNPSLSTIELLQAINHDFGIEGVSTSKKKLVEDLNQFLLQTLRQGGNALLIIDEGQNLSTECLEEIRMLSNLETEREKLLQILLIGQPELREKLNQPDLRQLNQRIAVRFHLEPLGLEETKGYVRYRLGVAGGRERTFFTTKALEKLYRHTGGVPRLVNILCDKALLAAYVQESRVVNHLSVERAVKEWGGLPQGASIRWNWNRSPRSRTTGKLRRKNIGLSVRYFTPAGVAVAGFLLGLLAVLIWGFPVWFGNGVPQGKGADNIRLPGASVGADSLSGIETVRVEPPAEVVIETELLGEPEPIISPAGFDPDGVYRVSRKEDTRKAAMLSLSHLWGTGPDPTPKEFAALKQDKLMARNGFSSYHFRPNLERIRSLDYPCLLEGHWSGGTDLSYAVLVHLTDEDATLLDPLNGRVIYDLEVLQTLWDKRGTIYWKQLPGIKLPLPVRKKDPSVKTLQKALRTQGLFPWKTDGILGPDTKRAIRFFNQKYGLKESNVFGPESFLVLSREMLQETPLLGAGDL